MIAFDPNAVWAPTKEKPDQRMTPKERVQWKEVLHELYLIMDPPSDPAAQIANARQFIRELMAMEELPSGSAWIENEIEA
jgi:hypothetical protein